MFLNISTGEIVIVFLIVLMLFGPKSIPSIARGLGRGIRQVKDAANDIQNEIRKSADKMEQDIDIKKELDLSKELKIDDELKNPLND